MHFNSKHTGDARGTTAATPAVRTCAPHRRVTDTASNPVSMTLPPTAELLVSGGDSRIVLAPDTGASMYGSRPQPDPALVALGSCTASIISSEGWDAADQLRTQLQQELERQSPSEVYAVHSERLRTQLLDACGCAPADQVQAMLAASGTDLFVLLSQWLRPDCTVMIEPSETGSGVAAAVSGHHFNDCSAAGTRQRPGERVGDWSGRVAGIAARQADGTLRPREQIDAQCAAEVETAAGAGQRVLLVLTDVSKTGLVVPSVDTALALRKRWPELVEVLVDGCQFRLSAATLRAYLAQDCLVALTGSKFMAGPTFCGALLVPPGCATRWREQVISEQSAAYSNAAEWPSGWPAARHLGHGVNFGLLLRWQAALAQVQAFAALPQDRVRAVAAEFMDVVCVRIARDPRFEAVPVDAPARGALSVADSWDTLPTIFPFLTLKRGDDGQLAPITRQQTRQLYLELGKADGAAPRYRLGQPVDCGQRDGQPIAALRLCLSAPLLVAACGPAGVAPLLRDAMAALDRVAELADRQ